MTKPLESIIARLKIIGEAEPKYRLELIEVFKQDFPNDLDWLDMFSSETQSDANNHNTRFPEIAGYVITELLGSGANGVVYLATKEANNTQVAIKVPMHFLSKDQMQRFGHETRLLSRLSHPNIAKIIEVGSMPEQNMPYMVMELVDGVTVHQYCVSKDLSSEQIVLLFIQVLDAVQYAHNRGIVHRDIKPENILVTQEGHVKLLDFGIALATDNSTQQLTELTKTGEIVGTLAYMSPEQVSGQNTLDTRADVYSLGVVLYQLLSNTLPHQLDANQIFSAISQIIEDLPTKLSVQNSKLESDLVTIVHHAIEKQPEGRYQSPRDFKKDLENWVQGDAISVKHNTLWYTIKHISKKHKALVVGSLLAVLGLITGLIFAITFALKEQDARKIAELNARTSNKTVEFINELFASADPENVFGEKLTLLQVIDNADQTLIGQLQGENVVEANIRNTIANVYISIGQFAKAQNQIDKVDQLLNAIEDGMIHRDLKFKLVMNQSSINIYKNQYKKNIQYLERQLADNKYSKIENLQMKLELANSLMSDGTLQEANVITDDVIEHYQLLRLADDSNLLYAQVTKAMILDKMGEFEKAKFLYEKIKKRRIETVGIKHPKTLTLMNNLATVERNLGNLHKAIKILKEIIQIKTEVLGANHLSTLVSKSNILVILIEQKQLKEADTYSLDLKKALTDSLGSLHPRTLEVSNMRAYLLEDLNRLPEAELLYQETLDQYRQAGMVSGTGLALLQNNLAMLLMKQSKLAQSQEVFQQLLDNIGKTLGKEHIYYAIFIGNYGELLLRMKKYSQARPLLEQSFKKLTETFGEMHQRTLKAKKRLEQLPKSE